MKKSSLYFLKLAARALNSPGVSCLSVNSTSLAWLIVLPNALSMLLLLMRVTMSGKVATAKACRSLAVLLPAALSVLSLLFLKLFLHHCFKIVYTSCKCDMSALIGMPLAVL